MQRIWCRCFIRAGLAAGLACVLSSGCASTAAVGDTGGYEGVETSAPALAAAVPSPPDGRSPGTSSPDLPGSPKPPAAAGGPSTSTASTAALPLRLETALDREQRLRVFSEENLGATTPTVLPPPAEHTETEAQLTADLAFATDMNRVPPGLRLSFKRLSWADLDGWERTGLVLSVASSVVGAGYLLYALFH